jgi:UDP-N-acetylmuramate--L-alanine ligase/UDP-N-acetylenolpyruvoylglucosamine reductase
MLSSPAGHIHCAGICGVGMAGVAYLLKVQGFEVTGCDIQINSLAEWLRVNNIEVLEGHSCSHINQNTKLVIRSSAVPETNEEIVFATERKIPVFLRGEILPRLAEQYRCCIAIAGTHGKTTTSFFVTQLLKWLGYSPSWCIGGKIVSLGGPAGYGGEKGIIVLEGDESDGTLALYFPDIAVVTNIEPDHLEHFQSFERLKQCFQTFVSQTKRRVIFCADDPGVSSVCKTIEKSFSYGISENAMLKAVNIEMSPESSSFDVVCEGNNLGRMKLPVPGRHNITNALAAWAVLREFDIESDRLIKAFETVRLPHRRFEKIVDAEDAVVISDYAHHPGEIQALVKTAEMVWKKDKGNKLSRRLRMIFQPHRYTRTKALGSEFPPAFTGVDELVLLPVYPASEQPIYGGSIWDLYVHFRSVPGIVPEIATSLEEIWLYLQRSFRRGDMLIVAGAGDVEKVAEWLKEMFDKNVNIDGKELNLLVHELQMKMKSSVLMVNEPLARRTTLGVGGNADIWSEIGSLFDLQNVLEVSRQCGLPFHIIGSGSNLLVSDLGVRGFVVRLTGPDFTRVTFQSRNVTAGAGVPVAALLDQLEEKGLGGLEFLQGIPGSVGGAVAMNAGAMGHEIGERVEKVRCMGYDGVERVKDSSELDFCYRGCKGVKDTIILDVTFKLEFSDSEHIRKERAKALAKREWQRGIRSAGCVFKNPEGDFAGRLLENAGLKGRRVGGARVFEQHANFIVTEDGATASDVLALMGLMKNEVAFRTGIELEPEIVFLS